MVKIFDEDGRKTVQYEDGKGRNWYTDAEKFIIGKDFSDKLPDQEPGKESQGLKGFEKLSVEEQEQFIKNQIGL